MTICTKLDCQSGHVKSPGHVRFIGSWSCRNSTRLHSWERSSYNLHMNVDSPSQAATAPTPDGQVDKPCARTRWPSWVYSVGGEPDARFSFANERTFLAWIRTSLALLAAGVAVGAIDFDLTHQLQRALALLLVVLALLCAFLSWFRWARSERALRLRRPLPPPALGCVLAAGLVVAAMAIVASILGGQWTTG
jgi:putative membrane protein